MPINASVGISTNSDPILAAREATRSAAAKLNNEKIDLAFAFSSAEFAGANLLKAIKLSLPADTALIGASGAAVITGQGILKHGVAVMLLSLPSNANFNLAAVEEINNKGSMNAGEELGQSLLSGFRNVARDLSIVFSDGMINDTSAFINGLQERLGKSFPLVGASVSDNLNFKKTYLYYNKSLLSDAACGLLMGGKISFGLGVKHGWKPLGKPHYVTKCSGNIVFEIDNKPAVKIYEEYFGASIAELKDKLKIISILYPIGIFLKGEEEYLLRNLSSIRGDNSLLFQGNIPQDSLIRLMIGTRESCLDATRAAAEEAGKAVRKNFALVFDSVSRYILLKRDAGKELEIIKKTLGEDFPIIGLYTYGEQAPLRAITYHGQTYYHNQSVAVITIGA